MSRQKDEADQAIASVNTSDLEKIEFKDGTDETFQYLLLTFADGTAMDIFSPGEPLIVKLSSES